MNTIQRICIHHTAGAGTANHIERRSYHFIYEVNGRLVIGNFTPENNIPPLVRGQYAPHCGGGNSRTIGVALAGQDKLINGRGVLFTREAFEHMCKHVAELCKKYGIAITPDTVYTHNEFGVKNPKTSSAGKIDITRIPWEPTLKSGEVGDYIRTKIRWYFEKLD